MSAVVQLTLDVVDMRSLVPHLGLHPVARSSLEADFRISFAKNKTHAYAYYTLTLKNIYGALPLANKFKEYHCTRGIYETTIEYLAAFPVHYGLVDAFLSADGPFGILPTPRRTIRKRSSVGRIWWPSTGSGRARWGLIR